MLSAKQFLFYYLWPVIFGLTVYTLHNNMQPNEGMAPNSPQLLPPPPPPSTPPPPPLLPPTHQTDLWTWRIRVLNHLQPVAAAARKAGCFRRWWWGRVGTRFDIIILILYFVCTVRGILQRHQYNTDDVTIILSLITTVKLPSSK